MYICNITALSSSMEKVIWAGSTLALDIIEQKLFSQMTQRTLYKCALNPRRIIYLRMLLLTLEEPIQFETREP